MSRNPTERFSDRVENYIRYRPGYPDAVVPFLTEHAGFGPGAVVADVGSGTGIFAELLLQHGAVVYGVEPNEPMRNAAERLLKDYERFQSINGTAEQTTLPDQSVDLVTAAQAFHWFDHRKTGREFRRILKPEGMVALIWNERLLDSSPFAVAYEALLKEFGTDYAVVRHENVTGGEKPVEKFFGSNSFREASFPNAQRLDFEGLKGRLLSSSYAPAPGEPRCDAMLDALRPLFDQHAEDGLITIDYSTNLFLGRPESR